MGPGNQTITADQVRAEIARRKAAAAPQGITADQVKAEIARRKARSELDAGINELANQVPGGYENWQKQAPDAQRMADMGYVQDPLAKTGFAKPRQPDAFETIQNNPASRNMATDAIRMMEAPIAGLTGGGLEGWAKTTSEDPLLGSNQAVEFISPVDDFARASYGFGQGVSGVATGDMDKAAQGFQQFATDGSYTAMQALPGSMTLKGISAPARVAPTTLAQAEKAAVAASRAPSLKAPTRAPKRAPPPATPDNVAPFSAPPEPSGPGIVGRNMDRIVGGAVGATAGGIGDAWGAEGDGGGDGPDIINPTTGGIAGMLAPRFARRAYRSGRSAMMGKGARAAFDERVAARAVRKGLVSGGLKTEQEALEAARARFGDKPAAVADLTQDSVGTATGLSRLPGATGEAARARGEDLLANRAGRLERDIADATGASPATISGDVDRMVALAREQATPAYERLRAQYPFGSLVSKRLDSLRDLDILAPHIRGVERYRETLAATEGRQVGDFEYWDLVKRSLDDAEQSAIARNQAVPYDLDSARQAIVKEMDQLVPDYPAARQLGGEAPKMQAAFRQGQGLLGGRYTADEVGRLVEGVTGQPLTALQAGVIRSLVAKTEGPRGAMASLTSAGARRKLERVFGRGPAEAMQARFAADAAIMENAQRINPNVGSVTSQANMGGGEGAMAMAAGALRAVRSPVETALAAMSKSGSYTKKQRDLMGEMLLDGPTPENLARIYRGKTRNGAPTRTPPAPNTGLGSSTASPTVAGAPTRTPPTDAGFVNPALLAPVVGGGIGYMAAPEDKKAEGAVIGAIGGGAIGAIAGKMAKGGKAPRKPAPAPKPPAAMAEAPKAPPAGPSASVSALPESMRLASARLKDGSTQDVVADVFTDRGVVVVSPSWPTNAGNDLADALVGRSNELRGPRKGFKVVDENYAPKAPREPSAAWSSQNPQEMADLTKQVADRFIGLSRNGDAHVLALTDEVDANSLASYLEANIPSSKQLVATRDGGEIAIVSKRFLRDNADQFAAPTWEPLYPSYNQGKGLRPAPAEWAAQKAPPASSPARRQELEAQIPLTRIKTSEGNKDVVATLFKNESGALVLSPEWPSDWYWVKQNPQSARRVEDAVLDNFDRTMRNNKSEIYDLPLLDGYNNARILNRIHDMKTPDQIVIRTKDGGDIAVVSRDYLAKNPERFPSPQWEFPFEQRPRRSSLPSGNYSIRNVGSETGTSYYVVFDEYGRNVSGDEWFVGKKAAKDWLDNATAGNKSSGQKAPPASPPVKPSGAPKKPN